MDGMGMGTTKTRKQCSTDNVGVLENIERFSAERLFLAHEPKPWPPCLLLIWIPEAPDGCSHKNHKGFKNPWVFSV